MSVMQPQHRSAKIRIDRLPGNAWDEAGSSREWVGECPRGSFAGRPAGTRRVNVRGATDFVVFEAGRDGFWLARWLRARGIEPHVIHAASVAVSRGHRRAKTDRLDTEHLKRVVLGWLRGEPITAE
jgi:hypothetical protein